MQSPRNELKEFHRAAEPLLEQEVLWFDERMRNAIALSFAAAATEVLCYGTAVVIAPQT